MFRWGNMYFLAVTVIKHQWRNRIALKIWSVDISFNGIALHTTTHTHTVIFGTHRQTAASTVTVTHTHNNTLTNCRIDCHSYTHPHTHTNTPINSQRTSLFITDWLAQHTPPTSIIYTRSIENFNSIRFGYTASVLVKNNHWSSHLEEHKWDNPDGDSH